VSVGTGILGYPGLDSADPATKNAARTAALQDTDLPVDNQAMFVGIHACDGLALQSNFENAYLTTKTTTLDEKPIEYLSPLI